MPRILCLLIIGLLGLPLTCALAESAEEAYSRTWSRPELEQVQQQSDQWLNNTIGERTYAPPPWTPMEVNGQTISCWGRAYRYDNSILPVQITSQGHDLLAAPPVFLLSDGQQTHRLQQAAVEITPRDTGLVQVRAVAAAGPYVLTALADYEFDGLAKITVRLAARSAAPTVTSLYLELPLVAERMPLAHWSGGRFGVEIDGNQLHPLRPPMSDAGRTTPEGRTLNAFREILWLGDQNVGLTWCADGMQGWQIADERAIQEIGPVQDGIRPLRFKLADRPFALQEPMELVFGLQATPMRPRPDDFRSLDKYDPRWGDERAIMWRWGWSEGHYMLEQDDHAAAARAYIQSQRDQGIEVMQAGSLLYYAIARYFSNQFGEIEHGGMYMAETLLWRELWENPYRELDFNEYAPTDLPVGSAEDILAIKQRTLRDLAAGRLGGHTVDQALAKDHTVPGEWYGKPYKPSPYPATYCPNSSFQDYYMWKLRQFIEDTGIATQYLDNGFRSCNHAGHGCGYIDYRGQWVGASPIFAMREMTKRIYFTYLETLGRPPLIKWHQSSQMLLPAMAYIDIHWNGELYVGGVAAHERDLTGGRYYSEILDEAVMQVMHSGNQFGYLSVLLPVLKRDLSVPRTAAYERDMMGLMMIHDSHVEGYTDFTFHPDLVHDIHRRRLAFPLDRMQVRYYWDPDNGLDISHERVRPILHYDDQQALLILFNWSGDIALDTHVELQRQRLGVPIGAITAEDLMTGQTIPLSSDQQLTLDILPRDFRMLRLTWNPPAEPQGE